jgi:hypothetical protein
MSISDYAKKLMIELEGLAQEFGLSHFEDADFPKIVEALEEMDITVLDHLMTDEKARIGLACTLCTLFTMGDVTIMMLEEGDLEAIADAMPPDIETKVTTKKKQTTH